MDVELRERDDSLGPDGGESPGLPDGSPLPERLAAEVRHREEERDRDLARRRRLWEKTIRRWIEGYPEFGYSWENKDLEAEATDEDADALGYRTMAKLRARGQEHRPSTPGTHVRPLGGGVTPRKPYTATSCLFPLV